jgi:hypothetical protein
LVAHPTISKEVRRAGVAEGRFIKKSTTSWQKTKALPGRERLCPFPGKGGKQIERCLISTFQVAESMGFKGDFRQWQELLRIGD